MVRFPIALAVLLSLASSALAQSPDFDFVALEVSSAEVRTDETFEVRARVRNNGPEAAFSAELQLAFNQSAFVSGIESSQGWNCFRSEAHFNHEILCRKDLWRAGEEGDFAARVAVGSPGSLRIRGSIRSYSDGSVADTRSTTLTVTQSPAATDLSVSGTAPDDVLPPGSPVASHFDVRNAGPDDAVQVVAVLQEMRAGSLLTAAGDGWTCTSLPFAVVCSLPLLRAGTNAPITATVTPWNVETRVDVLAQVRAEGSYDPNLSNQFSSVSFEVGSPQRWTRLLIPLTSSFRFGTGGAVWRTEIAALVSADHRVDYRPHPCEFVTILCTTSGEYPLDVPFDAFTIISDARFDEADGGQFLYVPASDAPRVHLNARVYDFAFPGASGTELPIVHEDQFTDKVVLLNVPAGPERRQALRVYDDGSRDVSRVSVRIFAPGERDPRATFVYALTPVRQNGTTSSRLRTHPGFAQVDVRALVRAHSLEELESLRIDVEPLDPGVRIWAFASVIDRATNHVTIVSPQ
jgi:hypothetical protein